MALNIAITGIGMVTPAGLTTADTWAGILTGRSYATSDPLLKRLKTTISCRLPPHDFKAALGALLVRRTDPSARYAIIAAREALTHAQLDPQRWNARRVAIVLGTAAAGISTVEHSHHVLNTKGAHHVPPSALPAFLPNMAAGHLSMAIGAQGPVMTVSSACASGSTAIGHAARLLAQQDCDIAIAGGTDAMVTPLCAAGFGQLGALSTRNHDPDGASRPFDADHDGFVLAEGAAILILERLTDARARGAPITAVIDGYGECADAHHPTAPQPGGVGSEYALREALRTAGATEADVDHVNAHGTSTPLGDATEAAMLARTLTSDFTVTSNKGALGHTMGAAGAIEAALTALAIRHQTIPPTANHHKPAQGCEDIRIIRGRPHPQLVRLAVSTSLGFGGHNAVLALRPAPDH
ncbi:beta-ketoacyl-[acyl-carrier-protein] synthase family protein [Streptomyces violaceusniger]|uniref:Beta-ketoacyl synthase n=1 Tax=Streptomyces violaceusniger (strain Tu 4113) TaxID=653045 RepID=G2PHJ8_STRV4|nr:beta-ketoacyl-[acyl-carrier-protein] synthase family protein [Streptomyces violaceusniger]AEM89001.1 Beta-ketoacyl synthase [Streptomyces violaceusniger Tu 4113]